ncbi:hypothetical protein K3725_15485 [Leisingera sp. S132]|uniref:hypothetical protein n=1 Tax=Leisingera sp. S132 TaxID=2867016 RepID=UPI0021A730CA|nr:hypothetical protein [Leisingera sp. S132]UWQ78696.1 hypothetical protein K3725_15485 [Leisingera sp. S132]
MQEETEAFIQADEEKAYEAENYSIYLHKDGIKCSTGWRLGSYGLDGVLNPGMKAHLGDRFSLPKKLVERLSIELGHCLNNDQNVAINLHEINKAQAIERGRKVLGKLIRQSKSEAYTRQDLLAALEKLSAFFAASPEDATLLPQAISALGNSEVITPDIVAALEHLRSTPGAAADLSPRDKRRAHDKRRQYIVETCCYAWKDAGYSLTYTTAFLFRKSHQRQGRLIEFIQTVVGMITEPSQGLSGETIRKDIDRLRDAIAREEEDFWAPPEFGN